MRTLPVLFVIICLSSFSQVEIHENLIIGGYNGVTLYPKYLKGSLHLVENIDFTTTDLVLSDNNSLYEQHISGNILNSNYDLDNIPGNETYQSQLFDNLNNLVVLAVPNDNFYDNSGLHIQTNKIENDVYSFHSLSSSYPYRYGMYEFEAKLPFGSGIVSSFFMYSDRTPFGPAYDCENNPLYNKNWQEIDVWETNGRWADDLRCDNHYTDRAVLGECNPPGPFNNNTEICEKCNNGYIAENTDLDFTNTFHTYTLYWDPSRVITFVDGYVFRYWVKDEPLIKKNGSPESVFFVDAMYLWLESKIFNREYQSNGNNDPLHGIDLANQPASTELLIKSFKHWVFIPCEDSDYKWYNNIEEVNRINAGLFETGNIIEMSDSQIEPGYDAGNPYPSQWRFGEKMHVIASERITLKPGFHASGDIANRNYPNKKEIFKAEVISCGETNNTVFPNIKFMDNGSTYLEQFWNNMDFKIKKSFENTGPWKMMQQDTISSNETSKDYSILSSDNDIVITSDKLLTNVCIYTIDGRLVSCPSLIHDQYEVRLNRNVLVQGFYLIVINDHLGEKIWVD